MGKVSNRQLKAEIDKVYFNQLCKSKRLTYTEVTEVAKYFTEWTAGQITDNVIEGTIGESQKGKFVRIQSCLGVSAFQLPENLCDSFNLGDNVKIALLK